MSDRQRQTSEMKNARPKNGGTGAAYPGKWVGRFIWDDGEIIPFHYFLRFRKDFDLSTAPTSAQIRVAAADRYMLYVNGLYIGRGPCRSVGADWTAYDTHDLTRHLAAGNNTVAVLGYYYGIRNCFSHDQPPGLFVQLDADLPEGERKVVGSDDTWKVKPCKGYRRDVRISGGISFTQAVPTEFFEAGQDEEDWIMPGFDDGSWEKALVRSGDIWSPIKEQSPWNYLEPRLTPQLREREVVAKKVFACGEVIPVPAVNSADPAVTESECDLKHLFTVEAGRVLKDSDVPERLLAEEHVALSTCKADGVEVLTGEGGAGCGALFHSAGGHDPFVILDFGQPYYGIPRLDFEAAKGTVVEITYLGGDGACLKNGRIVPTPFCRFGARYVAREGRQTWQLFEAQTAARYLQLVFRTSAAPVRVHSASLISLEYPVTQRGSFACSDEKLTQLWQAAVDTVYLHLEDTYVIDAVRERVPYAMVGEIEQSHLAYYAAYGDIAATELNFLHTLRTQLASGLLPMLSTSYLPPGFPREKVVLPLANSSAIIPCYSVFYAQAVLNRHRSFAKPGFLEEQYPALIRIAQWFERQADPKTGLLDNIIGPVWLDWPTHSSWSDKNVRNQGANFGINALYCKMFDDMADIASQLGHSNQAKNWRAASAVVRESLRRLFWNPERGLYTDIVIDDRQVELFSELLNGMALLYKIATPEQTTTIVGELTQPKSDLTRVSPLYLFYVLEGLIQAGAGDYVWRYLSERYAPVLAGSDFPTLPEKWPDQGDAAPGSMIHGGGAGVAWSLTSHVLGIRSTAPGFAEAVFDPQPGNLMWAKGLVPTPHGDIKVEWHRDVAGRIVPTIEAPEGVKMRFYAPAEDQ